MLQNLDAIPISLYSRILNNVTNGSNSNIRLIATTDRSKQETALKLHKQISHPRPEKLIKRYCAGEPWSCDEELTQLIKDISKICKTCQIYQKPPPRPFVGLPLAISFQECVAMHLQFYKKIYFYLSLIITVISSKDPKVIIKDIFNSWIQAHSAAEKFMSDNGAEFANGKFLDMCFGYSKITL